MPLESNQLFVLMIIGLSGAVLTFWVFIEYLATRAKARAKVAQTEAREETRREIAAYVAEGSISPDDAAKLMAAGAEGIAGGLGGLKNTIRECINASADACRTSGGSARRAAREAAAQARKQRVWGFHVSAPSCCDEQKPA